MLSDFNIFVQQSKDANKPSVLSHYLFDLCKLFNRFHGNVPVLKGENNQLICARLGLVKAFSDVLKVGLDLLGILPPNRM